MQAQQQPNPGEVPPPLPPIIPDPDPSPYPVEAPGDAPIPPLRDPDVIDPGAPVPKPSNPPAPSI